MTLSFGIRRVGSAHQPDVSAIHSYRFVVCNVIESAIGRKTNP